MDASRGDSEKHTLLHGREREPGESADGRSDGGSSTSTLLENMDSEGKLNKLDIEEGPQVSSASAQAAIRSNRVRLTFWMVVNTLATIGIVFVNKAIFDDPSFRQCQCTFAAFHFFVTTLTLYVLSRPWAGLFVPMHLRIRTMLPLAVAMCLNIILMNVSLAISTITFYQIARILLTPATVLLNFLFYRKTIPRNATLSLIPMCIGVGIISYYEPKPGASSKVASVGFVTVAVAVISVFCSAVYTVWISSYQRKYEINGFQLLYNQAPIGGVLLLYVIPWTDKFPVVQVVPAHKWVMILASGGFASLINLSQFFIIVGAGPVSSTVVGHVKTCLIVSLGWITAGRAVTDRSVFGVIVAIGSVF
ncbi:hypothetical protein MMC22_007402 [Lobaria immixta]|nr:hypothetical protein [Lobaria immixta]